MSKILAACVSVILFAALGVWVSHVFSPPLPVGVRLLQKLRVGASQNDVSALLGSPTQVMSDERTWSYYRKDGRKTVYIFFDTNMLYSRYEIDD